MRKIFITLFFFLFFSVFLQAFNITDSLRQQRPRILTDASSFDKLKETVKKDTLLQRYLIDVLEYAEEVISKPMPEYKLDEAGALLNVSRDCLDRILTLGTCYKMTGDKSYLENAEDLLSTVISFKDWHYYHFLDVAEMATAVSIGYDWFYDDLEPSFRDEIKEALIRNAIVPGLAVYGSSPWQYWLDVEYNWNQVCNGGLAIAALAIADTDPIYAQEIIPKVVSYLPKAIESYEPNGAWGEGVSYWFYATRYTAYCIGTLEASLGTDFGLINTPGFKKTGYFPIHMTTPSEGYFSYADIDMNKRAISLPVMFWLAKRFDNPHFSDYEHQILKTRKASALDVMYYLPPGINKGKPEKDALFGGIGKYAVMRESWDAPQGMYVAISGGDNRMNHGHLDKGSFELECDGIKWVRDLGSDKYHLPGYWEKEEGGERWKFFRLNTLGHSTLVVNGQNQKVNADAQFEKKGSDESKSFAVLDLSEAYNEQLAAAKRGILLSRDNRYVLLCDEFQTLPNTKEVCWQILTDASISGKGRKLTLSSGDKKLYITLLNKNARFSVESAEQSHPESKNEGFSKIIIRLNNPRKNENLSVVFSPNKQINFNNLNRSLSQW